jgi:CRISPR-associated protein Cas8a1/Csx13
VEPSVPPITWSLADEGIGILERAGLAALYMTLRAAQEQGVNLSPLEWTETDLTSTSVTLRWSGRDEDAFSKLFKWAWQVRDGVFYLPGVHRENEQRDFAFRRVTMHNGILGTFLQHPRIQPRAKAEDATVLPEQIEEGRHLQFRFRSVDPARHGMKPLKDLKALFRGERFVSDTVELSSWVLLVTGDVKVRKSGEVRRACS